MSDKRKKRKFDAKREKRRLKQLVDEGRVKNQVGIPAGAVAADLAQQVPNNSYSAKPLFYVDKQFACIDCGREETWTAEQQKWYYEVAKGSLYATAVHCRECRRTRHQGRGDPNPIKHVGSLMKRIRNAIEPELIAAGFELEARDYGDGSTTAWIEYVRPGLILQCLFDHYHGRLIAETMDDRANVSIVANVELCCPRTTRQLMDRIDEFTSKVNAFVREISGVLTASEGSDR